MLRSTRVATILDSLLLLLWFERIEYFLSLTWYHTRDDDNVEVQMIG